jgi:2-keto-4-pentenoate hydratase/2-oxohepta-3-ene-1,7-dioic acid hydratase in catechol pathway
MKTAFERLVRFKSTGGDVLFGEAPADDELVGKTVDVYEGSSPWDLKSAGKKAEIAEVCASREGISYRGANWSDSQVLSPLPAVPIFYGIGLNYKAHIAEASVSRD